MSSWRALISPNEEKYFGSFQESDSEKKTPEQKRSDSSTRKVISRSRLNYQMNGIKEKTQLRELLRNFPRLRERLCKSPLPSADEISTNLTANVSHEPQESMSNNSRLMKKQPGDDRVGLLNNEKRNTTNKKSMKSLEEDMLLTTMKKNRNVPAMSSSSDREKKKNTRSSQDLNINRFSCSLADSSKDSVIEYVSKLSKRLKEEKAEREKLSSEFSNFMSIINGFQNEINSLKENLPNARKEGGQAKRDYSSISLINSPRDTARLLHTSRSLNSPTSPINNYSFRKLGSNTKISQDLYQPSNSNQSIAISRGKEDVSFSKINHFKSRSQASEIQSDMFSSLKIPGSASHMRIMSSINNKFEDLSFEKSDVQTINSGRVSIDSILCGLIKINESGNKLRSLNHTEERIGQKLEFLRAQRKVFNDLMFEIKME